MKQSHKKRDKTAARKELRRRKKRIDRLESKIRRTSVVLWGTKCAAALEKGLPPGPVPAWPSMPPLETYALGMSGFINVIRDDPQSRHLCPRTRALWSYLNSEPEDDGADGENLGVHISMRAYTLSAIQWVQTGMVTVRTAPDTAAAYMLTGEKPTGPLPWRAVYLPLPPDLLTFQEKAEHRCVGLLVASDPPNVDEDACLRVFGIHDDGIPIVLFVSDRGAPELEALNPLLVPKPIAPLVLGFLAALVEQVRDRPPALTRAHSGDSTPWRIPGCEAPYAPLELTAPVKIRRDLTPLVQRIASGGTFGKYQWLVRGHFRNQRCGPKLTNVRRTWVPPYWKGPLDAPVLQRRYDLDG